MFQAIGYVLLYRGPHRHLSRNPKIAGFNVSISHYDEVSVGQMVSWIDASRG